MNRKRWGGRPEQPARLCKECGKTIESRQAKQFCSVQCRNVAVNHRQRQVKGSKCARCASYSYNRKSPLCVKCQDECSDEDLARYGVENLWTSDMLAYLAEHYEHDGGIETAEHIGLPLKVVYAKAQYLGLRVTDEARQSLVYDKLRDRMLADNPMKNAETQRKVKEWWENNPDKRADRDRRFLEGKQRDQRDKPSKLEYRLRAILQELGVAFEPSALIKPKFIVDIRIGQLIIQADGEYWHGHPRFEPLTDRQKQQQQRDAAQDAYLRACGYTVVRVWDRDVNAQHIASILDQYKELLKLPIYEA